MAEVVGWLRQEKETLEVQKSLAEQEAARWRGQAAHAERAAAEAREVRRRAVHSPLLRSWSKVPDAMACTICGLWLRACHAHESQHARCCLMRFAAQHSYRDQCQLGRRSSLLFSNLAQSHGQLCIREC